MKSSGRREDDDQGDHQKQAESRVAFLDGHRSPLSIADTLGDDRVKKLCTNGICDSSRSLSRVARATMPFATLSSTMQELATRKMLASSWVTMTIVMPRSRLSVTIS